jgi:hypothetical protein
MGTAAIAVAGVIAIARRGGTTVFFIVSREGGGVSLHLFSSDALSHVRVVLWPTSCSSVLK